MMARASSARCVVKDEPGRTDISLGSSLVCDTEQKDQQEEAICFHDVILITIKQHTQSKTLASNVQHVTCNTVTILKCTAFTVKKER